MLVEVELHKMVAVGAKQVPVVIVVREPAVLQMSELVGALPEDLEQQVVVVVVVSPSYSRMRFYFLVVALRPWGLMDLYHLLVV